MSHLLYHIYELFALCRDKLVALGTWPKWSLAWKLAWKMVITLIAGPGVDLWWVYPEARAQVDDHSLLEGEVWRESISPMGGYMIRFRLVEKAERPAYSVDVCWLGESPGGYQEFGEWIARSGGFDEEYKQGAYSEARSAIEQKTQNTIRNNRRLNHRTAFLADRSCVPAFLNSWGRPVEHPLIKSWSFEHLGDIEDIVSGAISWDEERAITLLLKAYDELERKRSIIWLEAIGAGALITASVLPTQAITGWTLRRTEIFLGIERLRPGAVALSRRAFLAWILPLATAAWFFTPTVMLTVAFDMRHKYLEKAYALAGAREGLKEMTTFQMPLSVGDHTVEGDDFWKSWREYFEVSGHELSLEINHQAYGGNVHGWHERETGRSVRYEPRGVMGVGDGGGDFEEAMVQMLTELGEHMAVGEVMLGAMSDVSKMCWPRRVGLEGEGKSGKAKVAQEIEVVCRDVGGD